MAVDRNSATATALRAIIEDLITAKSRSIERPTYAYPETQVMRGELKGYRKILGEVSLIAPDDEEEHESN